VTLRAPRLAIFALAALVAAALPAASRAQAAAAAGPLATVGGQPITEADVKAAASSQFAALEREFEQKRRDLLEGGLELAIQQRLVEIEAKAQGVSSEQLLAGVKTAEVTTADIDAFYEQNKAQIPQPKEQIADRIKSYLEGQRQQEARQTFFENLRAKHRVRMLIEPTRVEVAATGPAKGPADAPVTIIEFSDFQCPYCSRVVPTIDKLREKYGDKVRVVFRQFPLDFHQNAQKAAEASLCAHEQGKFWELHDAMFANQGALAVEQLKAKAAELKLDSAAFAQCLDSGKHAAAVKADLQAGIAAGVSGTPASFINGRFLNGAVPFEEFVKIIDDELQRAADKAGATGR
jgi:protein-disulfide isomerase